MLLTTSLIQLALVLMIVITTIVIKSELAAITIAVNDNESNRNKEVGFNGQGNWN